MTRIEDKWQREFDIKVASLLKEGKTISEIGRHLKCSDVRVTRSVIRMEKRKEDGNNNR